MKRVRVGLPKIRFNNYLVGKSRIRVVNDGDFQKKPKFRMSLKICQLMPQKCTLNAHLVCSKHCSKCLPKIN